MLRELIDIAVLEDFARGLARSIGLRVSVYGAHGSLVVAGDPLAEFGQRSSCLMTEIPAGQTLTPVPAHDPPDSVAFVEERGAWYVAAPVYLEDERAGWVAVGEFREEGEPHPDWVAAGVAAGETPGEIAATWRRLPVLSRSGSSHIVVAARWGARLLSEWCRREARLMAATEETALVGDIAELLTGREELQAILDRIVADTARVMRCERCSLRLYDPNTNELRIKAVHNLSPHYLSKGAVMRTENSIDAEALSGRLVYVEDVTSDPRVRYVEQMRAEGIVSLLTAGLLYRGRPIGVIRVYTDHRRRFRRTQQSLLRAVAHQAAIAIVHAQLMEQRLHSAQIERQLALAGEIQGRMMRIAPPRQPGLATASIYQPSSHLGGDFCDILLLRDGRLLAVVADVVGKGIPASILSASVRGALSAASDFCDDLGPLLAQLNRQICAETQPSEFTTLGVLAIDRANLRLGYASAGHEPLLLWRAGRVQVLDQGDLVLGLQPDEVYHEHTLALEVGDTLLLYSDGVVDAMNFSDELFGRARLLDTLTQYGGLPIDQVLRNVLWDVRRFVGLAEQSDDLTLVGVQVIPNDGR